MSKVFSLLKPYRLAMGVALTLMLIELGVELLHPLLMAKIIDDGILKNDLSVVIYWGSVMVGISIAAFAAGVTNSFYAAHVSQSFGYDVRKGLFEKVQSFSFANFSLFPTSSLITRMTNDVTQLQNTIFMSLRIMLRAPLLIVGGTIMALIVNFKLALILLISIPLLIGFLVWMMKKGSGLFKAVQDRLDSVNGVMQENLTGMRIIKAFLRRNYEVSRFTQANEELKSGTVSALRLMEIAMPVLLLVMNISILAILWFGSINVGTGDAKVGEVVAIVNYALRISSVLSIFSFIIMAFSRAKASAGRINEVLDTEADLTDSLDAEETSVIEKGEIEFKSVSFIYPGTNTAVLNNLSFTVNAGETIALLGATGSGKSSIFNLIPRLYDVSGGEIYIDGKNLLDMKLESLRGQIGFVPQESLLFTGSIRENIAWGKEGASLEEIKEAAINAQIHETIERLPDGYDTRVGQKGVNLSGGQKQRLSIARALVRKPKILLLDDSTSALDLATEAKLLKGIKAYECTIFIITQKISTAMEASQILLLDDGEILAQGSHHELMEESPLYQRIYESQFGEEALQDVQRAK
ncbi:ABC transporter ATP-binding protein/permease [Metabacillus idriensis]|uniref:ATP-binding cassette domain-containing protein n=1 Tax=Metabacillus idriensis TaxID=324768 RepID=A0A6I2MCM9_9BACI|nr:ABC transporter ATP-binding protein [Metabacillus idriensis]MCM3598347.1 ABC transporter ATP-binding protein/permease [Metabacillus idriensis]MRX55032.1 ATP-binding cassette domain-containing protein [Metabacillus idriensis]